MIGRHFFISVLAAIVFANAASVVPCSAIVSDPESYLPEADSKHFFECLSET